MSFWFRNRFDASPVNVFSRPSDFSPTSLPPFYDSLRLAWRPLGGCLSSSGLSVGSGTLDAFSLT